ncbi:MAG: PqqD family protein [Caldilineaceae bacterium]|nr:PqqD family protein [Caldilineaceae bacterium]
MAYRINTPRIISESIDDETIIIDFDSGAYFSARGVANRIWQWVEVGADLPQMIEGIAAEYDGDPSLMKASLSDFVEDLLARQLIVSAGGSSLPSSVVLPHDTAPTPFSAPVLEVYTDMQDLLLLDPIHDVGEQGWPHTR